MKTVRILLVLIVCSILGFLIFIIYDGYREKKQAEIRIKSIPDISFYSLDGSLVNLRSYAPSKNMIILYLHPECEHCRYEINAILENSDRFVESQIIMIASVDSLKILEDFEMEYHLTHYENIEILADLDFCFSDVFGSAALPSVFIYDSRGNLKKQFRGETKPDAIINEM